MEGPGRGVTGNAVTSAVTVAGGGLAGCEAAWQVASAGIPVVLMEMRPVVTTPAHRTPHLAELVCSNSLRSDAPTNAVGLLKSEMAVMGSLVMAAARASALPAGGALAVDRERFSSAVTSAITGHPGITVLREEARCLPQNPAIVATGPLTSPALLNALMPVTGSEHLAFFDAIAPVVAADSLDMSRLFRASRYGKGGGEDYLNAPMTRDEYDRFLEALRAADTVPPKEFERDIQYFEGCLPVEVMADRGEDTLRFGPLKPVGLTDPRTGRRPYAVVQLRQDDLAAEHWNLVGFQTRMTHAAQQQVLRLIPGLQHARFVRLGMVHRNTFLCSPRLLDETLCLRTVPGLRLAGQLTGVEGYVESAATGLLAGLFTAADIRGVMPERVAPWTAHGGLVRHLTARDPQRFQPANVAWGLMQDPPVALSRDKRVRRETAAAEALKAVTDFRSVFPWPIPSFAAG